MTKVLAGRILLAICIGISGLDYFGQTGASPVLGTWFSKAGKEAGNLAMYGGIAAGCLYVSRELFSWLKKRKEPGASIGPGICKKYGSICARGMCFWGMPPCRWLFYMAM
jgi:hypothetical protein